MAQRWTGDEAKKEAKGGKYGENSAGRGGEDVQRRKNIGRKFKGMPANNKKEKKKFRRGEGERKQGICPTREPVCLGKHHRE